MCGGMNNFYGKQKVDWLEFNNCVISVGLFINILSGFILGLSLICGKQPGVLNFLFACVAFGFVLIVEGTIASFFKVGD